ncbi:hypothetical protein SAMN04488570_0537 [Nocardioides scoriae]|uniref:Uncharacterized protein n=1 Tax=Nocardioides scoriae TaxID=642780 RepID=A0A1H1MD49_9ACTN|nr:hypothetical protein [Nocardioides scoriae]SDR84285.1 hypothetical protein SAMN04488570_0537 [Nocardioides scoriae]
MRRRTGYVTAWVLAAVLAVVVGLLAVSTVGASIRGRGPLGSEVVPEGVEGSVAPTQLADPGPSRALRGEWGRFVVRCRGSYAVGVEATPAQGWRTVSYERGPDDDVDAVFSNGRSSVDLEVFCNRGRPTIAELERNTLPDDD